MREIFEKERAPLRLATDAAISLMRQWTLRGDFRRPAASGAPFELIEPYRPCASALGTGGLAAAAAFGMVITALGHGNPPRLPIGVHHPSPHLLGVNRESVAGVDLRTTVKLGPEPEDPLRLVAESYFKSIRVLHSLDADGDLILSPWEILTAPGALRRLDRNHDGKLSAEECGFGMGGDSTPEEVEWARRRFMRDQNVV